MQDTLFGAIHTLVVPFLTEGEIPCLFLFTRRFVQFFHNSFVLEDTSEGDHLPSFQTMQGAQDFFALFVLAIFANAFDERTYQLPTEVGDQDNDNLIRCNEIFDLNAIPGTDRHQICHTRGLAMDLAFWFFHTYTFTDSENHEIDGFKKVLAPFTAHIGRHIIRYKNMAVQSTQTGAGSSEQVQDQIESAMFHLADVKSAYYDLVDFDHENGYQSDSSIEVPITPDRFDFPFNFGNFNIKKRDDCEGSRPRIVNLLEQGQNLADKRFFSGLSCQFDLSRHGNVLIGCPRCHYLLPL